MVEYKVPAIEGLLYIDKPFWNAEKQCADHKREYIGKYDGETFTPNKTFHRLKAEYEQSLTAHRTGRFLLISASASSMDPHIF